METILGHFINAKVCDLVTQNGYWDFNLMDSWMSVHLMDKIKVCVSLSLDLITDAFCFVERVIIVRSKG